MSLTIDALTMLSNATTLTNQLRRDLLKPNIQPRLQSLCKTGKEVDTTELLFGTNLADRVKVATESGKLGRRILPTSGMYPTGTYAGGLRGRRALAHPYYYPSYGMPSNRGYPGGRGRPFLGKSHTLLEPKISMRQSSENTVPLRMSVADTPNSDRDLCRPETGSGQHSRSSQADGRAIETNEPVPDEQVGEYAATRLKHRPGNTINLKKWGDHFIAGRVSQCVDQWAKITSDPHTLGNIRGYKLEFLETPVQERPMPEIKFSKEERTFLREEISDLLTKNVLIEA